jgi:hypothetical protein
MSKKPKTTHGASSDASCMTRSATVTDFFGVVMFAKLRAQGLLPISRGGAVIFSQIAALGSQVGFT